MTDQDGFTAEDAALIRATFETLIKEVKENRIHAISVSWMKRDSEGFLEDIKGFAAGCKSCCGMLVMSASEIGEELEHDELFKTETNGQVNPRKDN